MRRPNDCATLRILGTVAVTVFMLPTTTLGGVMGIWSLDEGDRTAIADTSPYGNHGTLTSDAMWTAHKTGYALEFPGYSGDEYATIPHNDSLRFMPGTHLSAWIRFQLQTENTLHPVLCKGHSSAAYGLYVTNDGTVRFLANYQTGGTFLQVDTSPGAVAPGIWTHVAVTYDGEFVRLFVNGVVKQEALFSDGVVDNNQSLYLGVDFPGFPERYKGEIDEVVLLSPSGQWSFDEGADTIIADSSPNGNDGTITSDTIWTFNGSRVAVQLPGYGGNEYATVPHDDSLSFAGSLYLSTWINFEVQAENTLHPIVCKGQSETAYALYVMNDGTLRFLANYQNSETLFHADTAPATIVPGAWTHVTASYDQYYLRLFVDGILEAKASFSHPIAGNDEPVYFGVDYPGFTERYKGQIGKAVLAIDLAPVDSDLDGTPDTLDNCPADSNVDQSDFDGDEVGDVCDADIDGDDVPDPIDACIYSPPGAPIIRDPNHPLYGTLFGDLDGDCDCDLLDYSVFQNDLTIPNP